VKTYEDTRIRQSVVSDTFQHLSDQAELWRAKIDLLEAGQHMGRAEMIADLGKLLDVCQNLRDAILSEDSAATWKTKDELQTLVDRLDDAAAKRRRYLDLAQWLAAGSVSHRRERTKQERLAQRGAAVAELMEISGLASPPELPGPPAAEWLSWACSLEDGTNDADLLNLKTNFPRVDDFVRQLEIELWQDGTVSIPDQIAHSNSGTIPGRDLPSDDSHGAGNSHSAPAETDDEVPGPRSWSHKPGSSGESATAVATQTPTAQAVEEKQELPAPAPAALETGRLCFFDENEVETFSGYIEQAKRATTLPRKVRALFATSQWLEPREQNPVLHSWCGIRAQIGYSGTTDLIPVSPEEAVTAISADDGLLLFTGGADLLRWSIAQRSMGHFDGIASIRRFSADQIREWFVEMYKIALSDPQVADICKLSSGIPMLVGELHRLIIPVPETPPTWLGYAIWTGIKSKFERRLAAFAQELRGGPPAVRLTDRELDVLEMVTIVSDHSTPETMASNLTEDWHEFNRPELEELSSEDEDCVAVLQGLGLLPMRRDSDLEPIDAIMPLEPNDAIRQIVSFL